MKTQNAADTGIRGLAPQLADSLTALTKLARSRFSEREQHEFLWFTLHDMAQQVADTVRDGALPLPSFRAWIAASHIVHDSFGTAGEVAWGRASSLLAASLAADAAQQAGGGQNNPQA
ncbi:hypothetical protein [Pantoea agglomerans]|uniref:hypothetical protein n=1 Tax=Enterobacter agglomerans TaxID=549 RepID=UPI000DAC9639|nr:hypothetical protein [Pantoea agglomerans]RAH26739.1 hypothetical protein DOT37_23145 [Pantoea agglomerans]TGX88532.1 hypothetical protein E5821_23230 [Pantoea agglomerans]